MGEIGGAIVVTNLNINGTSADQIYLNNWPCTLYLELHGLSQIRTPLTLEAKLIGTDGATAALFLPGHFVQTLHTISPGAFKLRASYKSRPRDGNRAIFSIVSALLIRGVCVIGNTIQGVIIDAQGPLITALGEEVTNNKSHAAFFLSGDVAIAPHQEEEFAS